MVSVFIVLLWLFTILTLHYCERLLFRDSGNIRYFGHSNPFWLIDWYQNQLLLRVIPIQSSVVAGATSDHLYYMQLAYMEKQSKINLYIHWGHV